MGKISNLNSRPEMHYSEEREQWRKRIKLKSGRNRDIWGDTKQEVRDQIKDIRRQEDAGLKLDDQTMLPEYAVKWYQTNTAGLSQSAKNDYSNAINKHIIPVLGTILLRDITPTTVREIMAACSHLSNRMQSRILGTLRGMLDAAEADGLIPRNPCKGIKPRGKKAAEKVPLSKEQQKSLVEAAKGEKLELFVLLCLYAGLRREEALGLCWEHVHLNRVYSASGTKNREQS